MHAREGQLWLYTYSDCLSIATSISEIIGTTHVGISGKSIRPWHQHKKQRVGLDLLPILNAVVYMSRLDG